MNATVSPAEKKSPAKRASKPVAAEKDPRQFDMFGDDPFAWDQVLQQAEVAQASVDVAIRVAPEILPAQAAAADPVSKENLDFARFMRTAGAPVGEVRGQLEVVGADADVVLARLDQVEAVIGVDYPAASAVESEQLVEEDAADLEDEVEDELTGDDGPAEEFDGAAGPLDEDSVPDARPKGKRAAAGADMATSAFSKFLATIRSSRYAPPTPERELELYHLMKGGTPAQCAAARAELIERNTRFLVLAAKRFLYTKRSLADLVSFGQAGLIVAAEKFDPTRGRFTACAAQWIRQSIQRELLKDNLLKTPAYMSTKASKLRKAADAATDPQEKARLTAEADDVVRELQARRATHVSLDGGQDDDSDSASLHNIFASEVEGPDEALEKRQLVTQMVRAAKSLPDERASDIFMLRLGLHDEHLGEPQTLAEVAGRYDISRERVRQIYTEAAVDVANAVIVWARGADNLPAGFKKKLMNPGRT